MTEERETQGTTEIVDLPSPGGRGRTALAQPGSTLGTRFGDAPVVDPAAPVSSGLTSLAAPDRKRPRTTAADGRQIVCEGLANIHRHTPAKRAFVELRFKPDSLAIEIGNECAPAVPPIAFVPRSIAERARALGGTTTVELRERGHDIVRVAIPL